MWSYSTMNNSIDIGINYIPTILIYSYKHIHLSISPCFDTLELLEQLCFSFTSSKLINKSFAVSRLKINRNRLEGKKTWYYRALHFHFGPGSMESTLWNGPIYYAKFRQNLEQIVHILARSGKEDSIKVQYYHNFMIDIFHPMKFDFETLFYEVPWKWVKMP